MKFYKKFLYSEIVIVLITIFLNFKLCVCQDISEIMPQSETINGNFEILLESKPETLKCNIEIFVNSNPESSEISKKFLTHFLKSIKSLYHIKPTTTVPNYIIRIVIRNSRTDVNRFFTAALITRASNEKKDDLNKFEIFLSLKALNFYAQQLENTCSNLIIEYDQKIFKPKKELLINDIKNKK